MANEVPKRLLDPIPVQNTYEKVISQLEERILGGELQEGDKLPSEEELARQAGVGRRTMREALKVLDMKGLIDVRKGQGAFVVRKDLDSYIESLTTNIKAYLANNTARLRDVLQFREMIEGGAVETLAEQNSKEIINKLETDIEKQKTGLEEMNPSIYNRAHLKFHHHIVSSMENPIISMIYIQVLNLIIKPMGDSGTNPEIEKNSILEHQNILKWMAQGNPDKAKKAVRTHLKTSYENLKRMLTSADAS